MEFSPHFERFSASSKRKYRSLFRDNKKGKNDPSSIKILTLSQRDLVTHLKHQAGKTHFWIKNWSVSWRKHVLICVFLHGIYCVSTDAESTQSRCVSFNNSEELNLWCEKRRPALTSAQPARFLLRGPPMPHVTEPVSVQGARDK